MKIDQAKIKKLWRQNTGLCIGLLVLVVVAAAGIAYRAASKPKTSPTASQTAITYYRDACANSDSRVQNTFSCYKSELTKIINQSDAESATALLKRQYPTSAYVKSNCHQLMHVVGRATYAKYGNLAEAFAHGDQYCWSGFYHGIMEQVSTEKGYDYIVKNANTICQPIAQKYGQNSFNDYNCVHGLGHGFMEIQNENLFDALKSCDSFSGSWNQNSCYGGVFMQNVMNVQGPEATPLADYPYLKADQPMYPCTAVDEQYKSACYLMQTSFALQADNYDFSQVFAQCAAVDANYVDTCYQSLGRDASGQSISDVQKTRATCLLGSDLNSQTNCTIGAVKDFVSYFHSDTKGYQLCAAMPNTITDTCNSTVKSYYSTF